MLLNTLAGIAWDPQIRGFLAVPVGVMVLLGSVYLLLATNIGARLGFLLAAPAVFGWLTIMGAVWWNYGTIGMLGKAPTGRSSRSSTPGPRPPVWRRLDPSTPPGFRRRGAQRHGGGGVRQDPSRPGEGPRRLADPARVQPRLRRGEGGCRRVLRRPSRHHARARTADDYLATYSFERGGKERLPDNPSRIDRLYKKFKTTFIQLKHPPRYAIIQVHPVIKQDPVPGQAPPLPEADPDKPVVR